MTRTIISLDPDDRAWLARQAKRERKPMTELVRPAVQQLRQRSAAAPFDALLGDTAGLWSQGDGLRYQQQLRQEWDAPK